MRTDGLTCECGGNINLERKDTCSCIKCFQRFFVVGNSAYRKLKQGSYEIATRIIVKDEWESFLKWNPCHESIYLEALKNYRNPVPRKKAVPKKEQKEILEKSFYQIIK